jgi:hypothetical protein
MTSPPCAVEKPLFSSGSLRGSSVSSELVSAGLANVSYIYTNYRDIDVLAWHSRRAVIASAAKSADVCNETLT